MQNLYARVRGSFSSSSSGCLCGFVVCVRPPNGLLRLRRCASPVVEISTNYSQNRMYRMISSARRHIQHSPPQGNRDCCEKRTVSFVRYHSSRPWSWLWTVFCECLRRQQAMRDTFSKGFFGLLLLAVSRFPKTADTGRPSSCRFVGIAVRNAPVGKIDQSESGGGGGARYLAHNFTGTGPIAVQSHLHWRTHTRLAGRPAIGPDPG